MYMNQQVVLLEYCKKGQKILMYLLFPLPSQRRTACDHRTRTMAAKMQVVSHKKMADDTECVYLINTIIDLMTHNNIHMLP